MKLSRLTTMILVLGFLSSFNGCSYNKTITIDTNVLSLISNVAKEEKNKISITFEEAATSKIKYKNWDAISYAKKYASLNDNSCGIYNNDSEKKLSDCAHFLAHCLNSGGIKIKANEPNLSICKDGLSYRVEELTTALYKLSQIYQNVTQISIKDAIIGDYGFFKIPAIRPTHAFMICKPAMNTDDITIYAHTTNRSCDKPEPRWYQFFDVAYRITDAN